MRYELYGYNLDNLIKTLHSKNIAITNLVRDSHNHIVFGVADKDANKAEKYIKNFKRQKTKTGIKHIFELLFERLGVFAGIAIGLIFYIFATQFTWQIKIYGTENLAVDDVLKVLEMSNVKVGAKNALTSDEIEEILLNNYDRIAQVSVIKRGTAIIINISEKLVYVEQRYEPIRARFSGIVASVSVVTGTVNVKVGDYVNAGDVLVLPFNVNADGEKVAVEPIAEINGKMFVVSKLEISRFETKLVRSGATTTEYRYKFGNHNLFSGKNKNSFALFEVQVYNENISNVLPLGRDVVTFYELIETTVEHNFEEEKVELENKAKDAVLSQVGDEIAQELTTNITIDEDKMSACAVLTFEGLMNG